MKVLYLTKYSRNGASSRLRSYQYFPFLEEEGIQVTAKPFFNEKYLIDLYDGKKTSVLKIIGFYIHRFCVLFTVFKYDQIVIEKELFPYFFSWFEQLFSLFNIRYIVDYDDAIFHNYDKHKLAIVRFLLKDKIPNVMRNSYCVIAGNNYLAQKAKKSGAKRIAILPTAIDIDRYKVPSKKEDNTVVIGWIGTPSTFKYVKKFEPIFVQLKQMYDIELHLIGAKEDNQRCKGIKFIEWSEEKEVELIAKFDIGIMPLDNTPWELGKCSYKLIQYMGCGKPVVASAIGMNKEVIKNGLNGFLVKDEQDWLGKISLLIENKELRLIQGSAGREIVKQKFNIHHNFFIVSSLLKDEISWKITSEKVEGDMLWSIS